MKYQLNHRELILAQEVIETFDCYRQRFDHQHESGGILFGRVYADKVIIESVSVPSGEDKSGRYYFYRNVKKAQKLVNEKWDESSGEVIYLGEWHTHPELIPKPSLTDRRLLANMMRDTKMDIDFLLMVIVGINNFFVASLDRDGNFIQIIQTNK
ncbi:Mov34/MPN/PAD-1 family protein [Paenibacillus arenilitoris]|uniref:Mov34/MPN/PAD-1 family protein n=1 Tax=Paenibacillus arenilitoris TaxID=2772299 RepID=A0A927CLB0_9BACL|nr:Mov34/MPN/PAD-1 family protein [Paenibacillus arenilitoris]MBD2869292.1 Mov34/MPN/PAD-1 family protein [Paenibacillus arenilitoris]